MKKTIVTLSLLSFQIVQAANTLLVASPDRSKIWASEIQTNHALLSTQACVAQIKGLSQQTGVEATLEVLALANSVQKYSEPTVMLSYKGVVFHAAQIKVTKGSQVSVFSLVRAENSNNPLTVAALAKIDERSNLIQALRAGDKAEITLLKNNTTVDRIAISLSGSTKSINSIQQNCR